MLKNYNGRFDQCVAQVKLGAVEGGEIRDAIILENLNWVNWHLLSVILPSTIEVCRILVQHFETFKKDELIKQFIKEMTTFISSPSLRTFLDARYEGKLRDMPSENKPNCENELELKSLYGELISLLINSV